MADISESDFAQLVALDVLTLHDHTVAAGHEMDATSHGPKLRRDLEKSEIVMVRRCEEIVAYMSLWPKGDGLWFVGMINTHPDYRNAGILRELIRGISVLIDQNNIKILRSNVYHTNLRSLALHKKLGFRQTRKNEFGLELTLEVNRGKSILQRFLS